MGPLDIQTTLTTVYRLLYNTSATRPLPANLSGLRRTKRPIHTGGQGRPEKEVPMFKLKRRKFDILKFIRKEEGKQGRREPRRLMNPFRMKVAFA